MTDSLSKEPERQLPSTDEVLTLALGMYEGGELPDPWCDSDWHTDRRHMVRPLNAPDPLGEHCPYCLGDWWDCSGDPDSGPSDPALSWLQIIARRRADA